MITLSNAAAITKTKIATLKPDFAAKAHAWFDACVQAGLLPYIYEGYRSNERQNELYAQGRTAPGKIVTNAMAGQSFHNYGYAFDWVPLRRVDKAADMYEAMWVDNASYAKGNALAHGFGMRSLSWEQPHLEDARFANWRELAAL